MPSAYLALAEIAAFGVPNATSAQIVSASAIVDAYLRRPEGLQWLPDYSGAPCYMAGLPPTFTLKATGAVTAGVNVSVPVTVPGGMLSTFGSVGDVVIFDRASSTAVEACVISSVAPGAIVLANVAQSHASGASLDFGLVIREQRSMPAKRTVTRLANWPIARLISGLGTYRTGRRSQQNAGEYIDQGMLSILQAFGGASPQWYPFDPATADVNPATGEIWIPSNGVYMSLFSDVRLYYVAGFSQGAIPTAVKNATAAAILGGMNSANLAGGLKMAKAGDTALERFANSVIDADIRAQLDMYRPRLFL
jgi:hypothetical protein